MKIEDTCYRGGNTELRLMFLSNLLYVGYPEQMWSVSNESGRSTEPPSSMDRAEEAIPGEASDLNEAFLREDWLSEGESEGLEEMSEWNWGPKRRRV